MELHLLCGIPGCGKSTLVKSLSGFIVSTDELRKFLWNDETFLKYDKLVFELAETTVKYLLSIKQDVIVDSTNINSRRRKVYIDLAKIYGARVTVHWVNCPLSTALEQNSQRQRNVPEAVIRSMYKAFQPPGIQEGIDEIKIYQTASLNIQSVIKA